MPTFPLGFIHHQLHAANAKRLEKIARTTGGSIIVERQRMQHTAADSLTLRGIPAIGRGVSGASPGSRPDAICDRDT